MPASPRLVALTAICLVLSACRDWSGDGRVEVRNQASERVSDIVVETGGLTLPVEPLEPGAASAQWFSAVADSTLHMRYRLGGTAPRECSGDVYVTGAGSDRLVVTILPDGTCRVERILD
jgi:hypothetical protein